MSNINLGRTTKTNIIIYRADGLGRDGYITYNDAGFWKDKQILTKEKYPRKKFQIFHSLIHQPAPFKYFNDGSGRDSYVSDNTSGLIKNFEPLAQQKLEKFLRIGNERQTFKNKIFLNKTQRRYLNKLKKIQDKVIKRLYDDSLEKLKKNNFQCRTNSYNELFDKEKIRPMTSSILTPKNMSMSLNYINSQQNPSRNLRECKQKFSEKFANLNTNTYRNKNIFQKFFKNGLKNFTNKRIKVLKNLRINSPGLKCDFIPDNSKKYNETNNTNNTNNTNITNESNNLNSLSPNFTTNKNLMFDYRNNIKTFYRNKNPCNFSNNTFGFPLSAIHRNKTSEEHKFNFNFKKRNDIKKFILLNRNRNLNKLNNTNN